MREVNVGKYYPNVTKDYREIKKIPPAEDPEFNLVWQKIGNTWSDQFIRTLLISGIVRWEAMLKLRPLATDTLEDRRIRILTKINEQLPYTYRRLEQILNALCGAGRYEIDLDYNRYNLAIITNPDETHGIQAIGRTLRPIIPANLTLFVTLAVILAWPIGHRAALRQKVDARHNFWNLGEIKRAYWDGEYPADGTIRGNAIRPGANYRERQQHSVEMQMLVDARQSCHWYNVADGAVLADGSHFAIGSRLAAPVEHACTITIAKNGVKSMPEII